jgi:hypothetical protein
MKLWGIAFLILLSVQAFAQHINGLIIDKATGLPVPNAVVKKGYSIQLSSASGDFVLSNTHFGDTIRVTIVGYKPYKTVIGMVRKDTMMVYLEENSIMLNNVTVNSRHDYQRDSINARKEFAKVFAYKSPTISDAFLKVDPYAEHHDDFIYATNSTASLVGISLGSVIGLFTNNESPESRLNRLAGRSEELTYVDRRFSKGKITAITKFTGEELAAFMDRYRPSITQIRQMSDYDIIVYIKKCYAEYMKNKSRR